MSAWKKWCLLLTLAAVYAAAPLAPAEEAPGETAAAEEAAFPQVDPADAALTVTASGKKKTLLAGKKLQFKAVFANPEAVSPEIGNDGVTWSVAREDGSPVSASQARISKSGQLTAGKVKKALNLVVTAVSDAYGTRAEYPVLVHPKAARVTVKSSGPTAFLGRDPIQVRASTVPAGLEKTLTWSIGNKKLAKLHCNEDGSVTITPLKAGTTTLTAQSSGGASTHVTLRVAKSIQKLKIVGESFVRKGDRLQLSYRCTPRDVKISGVHWALDVGPEIAIITNQGRLKPSASCPVGTVITVSCWPRGSGKSIVATKEITVTYAKVRLGK